MANAGDSPQLASELNIDELAALIRRIVREELERAPGALIRPPVSVPLGAADLHAAAKHFKTTYSAVREWVLEGGAPAIEVERNGAKHRQWRVDLVQLEGWVRGGGVEALERKKKASQPTAEDLAKARAALDERARKKGYVDWRHMHESRR